MLSTITKWTFYLVVGPLIALSIAFIIGPLLSFSLGILRGTGVIPGELGLLKSGSVLLKILVYISYAVGFVAALYLNPKIYNWFLNKFSCPGR